MPTGTPPLGIAKTVGFLKLKFKSFAANFLPASWRFEKIGGLYNINFRAWLQALGRCLLVPGQDR